MPAIKWTKPSGTVITTNDRPETVEYCKSLGWKKKAAPKSAPKKVKAD